MSNINPQSIDGTYPIAGQDNNSQGFRDNFTNTVNNFTFAAAELNDLQQNAVLKAALGSVGQSGTPTNDLNYAYITHAQMIGTVETKKAFGNVTVGGSIPIDWSQGHFQTVDLVGANATVSFGTTWPATNLYTRLRLQCNTYTVSCNLALPLAVSTNISSIQGASGQTINLPAGGVYVFEFSTWDNGSTIAIQDVLRNYDIVANGASSIFTSVTVNGQTSTQTLSASGRIYANATIPASSATTGALVVAGGVGIGGNLYVGAGIQNTLIGNTTPASGAFTTLSATGEVTITGNVIRAGGTIDSGYQYYNPSGNGAVTGTGNLTATINTTVSRVIINPTAAVSVSANLTLPGGNVDAKVITISSTQTIQFLSVMPSNGTSLVNVGNISLTGGTSVSYFYHASQVTWYKIG